MHRDLKAACAKPSAYDLKAQQRKLNHFVKEYNHLQPHEALGLETSGSIHRFLPALFLKEYDNLITHQARKL